MNRALFLTLLISFTLPILAQNQPVYAELSADEQLSLVGILLPDLIERFGSPRSVIAERGYEVWQDDVVFQYNGADFYIYRDRIWQIKFASTQGVSNGEPKAAVLLALGNNAEDRGDHILMPLTSKNWPLMLRVNFSDIGRVAAIFIYRPDF
ncbi:MAG: hypothetical protein FWD22_05420 [Treponema sp.]|nr:hypothetical protein [Treponema sp.]